jgi:septum formation topological specificity factor MinE
MVLLVSNEMTSEAQCMNDPRSAESLHGRPPQAVSVRTSVSVAGPLQMNLADRFMRVAKANLNSILAKVEDPEKVLEQAVEDMQRDLVKVRQSYAEVSATQKRFERQRVEAQR